MPRTALSVLLASALLAAQPACQTMSQNNHRGIQYVGGAAAFVGLIMVADGASCSEDADAALSCDGESDEVLYGGLLFGAGVAALVAARYLLKTNDRD